MQPFFTQIQDMASRIGPQAYISGVGTLLLFLTGMVSFWLLLYSLISHNWAPWKYIKRMLFISIGMIVFAIIITVIEGVLFKK